MITRIADIMETKFPSISILDSVKKAVDLLFSSNCDCCPVFDQDRLVGIVSCRNLMKTHPNRIIADALSNDYITISSDASIWYGREIFEANEKVIALFAMHKKKLVGLVDRQTLYSKTDAQIDLLTGLHKSDYLYYKAENLLSKGCEISIVFIDVNNFGYIDKEYGHIVGDNILKELAVVLKNNMPGDVILCRYGGDEFTILTTYNDTKCKDFAVNLQKAISSSTFTNNIEVSIAIGVAGGRRGKKRPKNPLTVVLDLVNLASLASTKAKNVDNGFFMEGYIEIGDIA